MSRVKFLPGKQREFLELVLEKLHCPSLRTFEQFGFDIPYSTLKNYFSESRLLPLDFFETLCALARLDKSNFNIRIWQEHWGQIKGGRKSSF